MTPPKPRRAEHVFMLLMLLIATGDPLLVIGGHVQGDAPQANSRSIALWILCYILAVVFARPVRDRVLRAAMLDWPVLALTGLTLASTAWSVDPAITAKRSVALLGTCVVGWYAAARFDLDELQRQLTWACALAVAGSLVFVLIPGLGIAPPPLEGQEVEGYVDAWRGIYTTKNLLGQVSSLAAPVLLLGAAGARGWRRAAVGAVALGALVLVWMTHSATGLVVTVTLVAVSGMLLLLRIHPYAGAAAGAVLAGVGGGGLAVALSNPDAVFGVVGRDATLTGRTELWGLVVDQIRERPWLGWGHAAFWNDWTGIGSNRILEAVSWTPGYAHNGFLDQALGLGVVGLGVLSWGLVGAWRAALPLVRRVPSASTAVWPAVVLAYLVLTNVTEGGLVQQNGYMWVLFVIVSAAARLIRDDARAAAAAPLRATVAPARPTLQSAASGVGPRGAFARTENR